MTDDDGIPIGREPSDLRGLVEAHVAARRNRDARREVRQYHETRAAALVGAFGIHLEKPPFPDDGLGDLLRETIDQLVEVASVASPFDGYLEAPMPVIQLHRRHADPITEGRARLHSALMGLAVDIVARLWRIDPDTTVAREEVAAHGFDQPPVLEDPLDDW